MSDQTVSTEFKIVDNISHSLGIMKGSTASFGKVVDSVKSKIHDFTHSIFGIASGFAGGLGIYEIGKNIYEMGEFSEHAENQLMALAQQMGAVKRSDIAGGLKYARGMMKDLMGDANRLGISFKELASTFPKLAMQAQASGVPVNTIKTLFERLSPIANEFGMSTQALGENLQGAFIGRIPRELKTILGTLGMSAQQMKIMQRIGMFGDVKGIVGMMSSVVKGQEATAIIARHQETVEALTNKIKNSFTDIYMLVGQIVLKDLAGYMKQAYDWINKNQVLIKQTANTIAKDIGIGMKDLVKVLGFVQEHWKSILGLVLAVKYGSSIMAVGGMIGGAAKTVGFMSQYGSLSAGFAGLAGVIGKNIINFGLLAASTWAAYEVFTVISTLRDIHNIKKATAAENIATTINANKEISSRLSTFQRLGMIGKGQKDAMEWMIKKDLPKALAQQMMGTLNLLKVVSKDVNIQKSEKPPVAGHQTNIYGDIHITQDFKEGALPDKVMLRFTADLEALAEKQRISTQAIPFGAM